MRKRALAVPIGAVGALFVLLPVVAFGSIASELSPRTLKQGYTQPGLYELDDGSSALLGNRSGKVSVLKRYSTTEAEGIARRLRGLEVNSGATGQTSDVVAAMTPADIAASDAMHADLAGQLTADTAQAIVDDVGTKARLIGALPSLDTVAAAMPGVVELAGAAYLGVQLGKGIDELLGIGQLEDAVRVEPGCVFTFTEKCANRVHSFKIVYKTARACNSALPGGFPGPQGGGTCIGMELHGEGVHKYRGIFCECEGEETELFSISDFYTPTAEAFHPFKDIQVETYAGYPCPFTELNGDCFNYKRGKQIRDVAIPQSELCEHQQHVEAGCITVPETPPLTVPVQAPKEHEEVIGPVVPYVAKESEKDYPGIGKEVPNPLNPEIPFPEPSETGTHYVERLEELGFTEVELTDRPTVEEGIGPFVVTGVTPNPGSREAPTTKIRVEQNPETSPLESPGGGIGPPTLPGINLPKFNIACHSFPFGVPCWIVEEFSAWSATSKVPEWETGEYTVHGKKIPSAHVSLAFAEPIMVIVRPFMILFSTIGLVVLFYRWSTGKGVGTTGEGEVQEERGDD